MSKLKKILLSISALLVVSLLTIPFCNSIVEKAAAAHTYSSIDSLPHAKIGLLLGTSKTLRNGTDNLYYKYRIDAAAELIKAKKIDYLIISGDNGNAGYDEPTDMKNSLIELGIDSTILYLDYAGFRTYDSMIRLKEVFDQTDVTVISQKFHNERAIYIGQKINLTVNGYNARDVNKYFGFKTNLREKFARVKVVLDFLLGIEPKFLGPKVHIG